MADTRQLRPPSPGAAPHRRFDTVRTFGLAAGTVTAAGQVQYEVVPLYGKTSVSVRLKVATNGGTLDFFGLGPDFNPAQANDNTTFASLVGTIYTTGNPAQVAVTAGTEALITYTGKGEHYGIVKYVGATGAGSITYADVSYQHITPV